MPERKRTLLQQLKSRKIWLEKFVGRELDTDERDYLAMFAQQDFLLVYERESGPAKLLRVTPRHGSLICESNAPNNVRAIKDAAPRRKPSTSRPARAPAQKPSSPALNPGLGWIRQPDGSYVFGVAELTQTYLKPVNEHVWQAWVRGAPLLETPSDVVECACRAENWLTGYRERQQHKLDTVQNELNQLVETDQPRQAIHNKYQQVLEFQLWVARFDQMLKGISQPAKQAVRAQPQAVVSEAR